MNSLKLTENWEEQKVILIQKIAALTDNDLLFTKSKKEEILEKIQIKLGKTKEEILKIIKSI